MRLLRRMRFARSSNIATPNHCSPQNPTINRKTKKVKQPYEKLGLSETAFLLAYSQGYRDAYSKSNCSYRKGTALRKAYDKGRREAKKF